VEHVMYYLSIATLNVYIFRVHIPTTKHLALETNKKRINEPSSIRSKILHVLA